MGGVNGEALIVVDMLNDFVLPGAPLEVPTARQVVPAIKARIEQARARGTAIIYLCDAHSQHDQEFKVWPSHAVKGTKGAQVVEEIAPRPEDLVIEKTTYSAFYRTRLEEELKRLKVARLIIVGVLTNICIFFTAVEAVVRGFGVEVPRDSVATVSQREQDFALEQMEKVFKVKLI